MQLENTPIRVPAFAALLFAASAVVLLLVPAAFADDQIVYDKADAYQEAVETDEYAVRLLSSFEPMALPDEMKYFASEESGQNYAQTLSYGDGYNAMGYYQFDRRYCLQDFIIACYNYDPVTYAAFEPFTSKDFVDLATVDIRVENEQTGKTEFTEVAKALNAAWEAAYNANPEEFAGLQDAWAYEEYYLPARNYLVSKGISIDERADCVKGLCWGMCNLFGSGGWRKFVVGSGVNDGMTDVQFVYSLCNYLIANVDGYTWGSSYKSRYKREMKTCFGYLGYAYDINPYAWYMEAYDYVMSNGIMHGKDDGTFAPNESLTRAQAAAVLYNHLGNGEIAPATDHRDVLPGKWYSEAVNWCVANGVMNGYAGTDTFGVSDYVTREQVACIIANAANADISSADASRFYSLPDCMETSSWAREGVIWAVSNGIINGKDDVVNGVKYLVPLEYATRAQMAAIMMNVTKAGIL